MLVLEVLQETALVGRLDDVLHVARLGQNLLHHRVDRLEARRRLGKLLLHLVGVDEQRLEVRPRALDLGKNLVHIRHHHQFLVPARDGLLERLHVPVREHALHDNLVVLQRLEVLLAELDRVHVRVLVLHLHPLHLGPGHLQLRQGNLHLRLLLRAVDDLAHLVLELVQLEREQRVERELVVNDEGLARDFHERAPVPVAHVRRPQVRNQRHGREEVLDRVVQPDERVRRAQLLGQALDVLLERLRRVLHGGGVDVAPQRLAPLRELLLHQRGVVPDVLDHAQVLAALRHALGALLDHVRELEHVRQVGQVLQLLLQRRHLQRGGVQLRIRFGESGGVREDGALGKRRAVLRNLGGERADLRLDLVPS